MRKQLTAMLVTCGLFGIAVPPVHALCGQTMATTAEMDLFSVHGCDTEFINRTKKAGNLRQSDWVDRGWDNAGSCNILYEFPKFWNAWYLVAYGIQDVPPPLACQPGAICLDVRERPWHDGKRDYWTLVEAGNYWHRAFYYRPKDDLDPVAEYDYKRCEDPGYSIFGDIAKIGCEASGYESRKISLSCRLFDREPTGDPPSFGATPSSRAAVYVHESWHAWNEANDFIITQDMSASGHEVEGPGDEGSSCRQTACDHFYPHTPGEFWAGGMWISGQEGKSKISVWQAQLEYACDLSDHAATWVPYSVRESAANDAGYLAKNTFIERVPFWCGSSRPLWGMRPGGRPEWCTDQRRASCHPGCNSGGRCGNDGCCINPCATHSTCGPDYSCPPGENYCDILTGCCGYIVR